MYYPAIVTTEGPHLLIVFPDLPECQVIASRNDNLLKLAQDALVRHLQTILLNQEMPPHPSEEIRMEGPVQGLVVPVPEELAGALEARWS